MSEEVSTIVPAQLVDLYTRIIATHEQGISNMQRHLRWHEHQETLYKQAVRLIRKQLSNEAWQLALTALQWNRTFERADFRDDKIEMADMQRSLNKYIKGEMSNEMNLSFCFEKDFNPTEML